MGYRSAQVPEIDGVAGGASSDKVDGMWKQREDSNDENKRLGIGNNEKMVIILLVSGSCAKKYERYWMG